MTQWNVTFSNGPSKTSFTRQVDADTRDGAIVAARANLYCPAMWTLSGAVAVMSPDEAAKIAAWVDEVTAKIDKRLLEEDRERESAATFNGG